MTLEASPIVEHEWEKCVLCQEDKNEKLVCPADSKEKDVEAGYVSLANDVIVFDNAGCFINTLSVSRMDDGDGLEITLKRHRAKFQSSCQPQYSKQTTAGHEEENHRF